MTAAIVLGAGMVGMSTAIALRDRGWEVTLIDRNLPGRETSFGNAGIIQSECVEPHAMPRSPEALLRIATGRTNDVYYSLPDLPRHLPALVRYWWHSQPGRHRAIALSYARLIGRAIGTHGPLIARAGADNLVQRQGYRALYRDAGMFEQAVREAERVKALFGTPFSAMDAAATRAHEPALCQAGAGSIHWPEPWTVRDPGQLVSAYGDLFQRSGGTFVQAAVTSLDRADIVWRVRTDAGSFDAPHVVVAMGVWSSGLLARFGLNFPMVLKRGYHAHYASPRPLHIATLDMANGYVMAPMRAGTRITTGAHLTSPGGKAHYRQLDRAEQAASEVFDLGERIEPLPWSGTRPCMPDMLPVIGSVEGQAGLWLNFGHGHQGFTLGPASAELLGAMMAGERPPIDPAPFRPGRYRHRPLL